MQYFYPNQTYWPQFVPYYPHYPQNVPVYSEEIYSSVEVETQTSVPELKEIQKKNACIQTSKASKKSVKIQTKKEKKKNVAIQVNLFEKEMKTLKRLEDRVLILDEEAEKQNLFFQKSIKEKNKKIEMLKCENETLKMQFENVVERCELLDNNVTQLTTEKEKIRVQLVRLVGQWRSIYDKEKKANEENKQLKDVQFHLFTKKWKIICFERLPQKFML